MSDIGISGTSDPYSKTYYSAQSNDKNTLSITNYFQLLAAQLQYQDMNNPMDNSEMMAQMTQMAMVQSLTTMTEAMETSTAVSTSTYAAGLVGKNVTVAVTEKNSYGQPVPTGVKYGVVESVNFTGSTPILKLEGDDTEYPLSYLLGMGKIDDPYVKPPEDEDGKTEGSGGVDGEGGTEGGQGGPDGSGGADGDGPENSKAIKGII